MLEPMTIAHARVTRQPVSLMPWPGRERAVDAAERHARQGLTSRFLLSIGNEGTSLADNLRVVDGPNGPLGSGLSPVDVLRAGMSRAVDLALPLVVAAAWLLTLFGETGSPLWALWRPLLVIVTFTVVIQVAATLGTRSLAIGALITTIIVTAVAAFWVLSLPLVGLCAWWIAVNYIRRRQGRPLIGRAFLENRVHELGVVSAIALVLVVGQAAVGGIYWNPTIDRSGARAETGSPRHLRHPAGRIPASKRSDNSVPD